MAGLTHETVSVSSLSFDDWEDMYRLMQTYYLGVTRAQFDQDLAEKERVILLRRGRIGGKVAGFSTIMRYDLNVDGRAVKVVFSGDTVVDRGSRGTLGLGVEIARYFVQSLGESSNEELFYIGAPR